MSKVCPVYFCVWGALYLPTVVLIQFQLISQFTPNLLRILHVMVNVSNFTDTVNSYFFVCREIHQTLLKKKKKLNLRILYNFGLNSSIYTKIFVLLLYKKCWLLCSSDVGVYLLIWSQELSCEACREALHSRCDHSERLYNPMWTAS